MPKIKLPSGGGDWNLLEREHGAELWSRRMRQPDGVHVTFYVVGSENTPEIHYDQSESSARNVFARFQALGG